jgi:hypothetical protein
MKLITEKLTGFSREKPGDFDKPNRKDAGRISDKISKKIFSVFHNFFKFQTHTTKGFGARMRRGDFKKIARLITGRGG